MLKVIVPAVTMDSFFIRTIVSLLLKLLTKLFTMPNAAQKNLKK